MKTFLPCVRDERRSLMKNQREALKVAIEHAKKPGFDHYSSAEIYRYQEGVEVGNR